MRRTTPTAASTLVVSMVTLLAALLATAWVAEPATAARSSKPKEIVVVGSKVKDVVREAGLVAEKDFLRAIDRAVLAEIRSAVKRAIRNRRDTVRGFDLGCPAPIARVEPGLVDRDAVSALLRRRGFGEGDEFGDVLDATVERMLTNATGRTVSNGRSTVRPYDL